jgi:hypothetical protein
MVSMMVSSVVYGGIYNLSLSGFAPVPGQAMA